MNSQGTKTLRLGTRRSALAKSQTQWVIEQIRRVHPDLNIETIEVVTTGDKILDTSLSLIPGKGVFTKEIEEKLSSGEIDLAVHSMKDLPTKLPTGLRLAVVPPRVDPRDIFISRTRKNLEEMPTGAKIGTGSLRRSAQLLHVRSDFNMVNIRGNIDTRLKKASTPDYDGIVLAAAGLIRMGWQDKIQQILTCKTMIPAVAQGALGIEIRISDEWTFAHIQHLNDMGTQRSVAAERLFLEEMGGGCKTPMGAFCREREGRVVFHAFGADEDGQNLRRATEEGALADADKLAMRLVDRLR